MKKIVYSMIIWGIVYFILSPLVLLSMTQANPILALIALILIPCSFLILYKLDKLKSRNFFTQRILELFLVVPMHFIVYISIPLIWVGIYYCFNMDQTALEYNLADISLISANSTSCAYSVVSDYQFKQGSLGINLLYKGSLVEMLDTEKRILNLKISNELEPIDSCHVKFEINPKDLPFIRSHRSHNHTFPGLHILCNGECNLIGKTADRYIDMVDNNLTLMTYGNKSIFNINMAAISMNTANILINSGNIQFSKLKVKNDSSIITNKGDIIIQQEEVNVLLKNQKQTYCFGGTNLQKNETLFTSITDSPILSSIPHLKLESKGQIKVNKYMEETKLDRTKYLSNYEEKALNFTNTGYKELLKLKDKLNNKEKQETNIILETHNINSESSKYLKWVISKKEAYVEGAPWYLAVMTMSTTHARPYHLVAGLTYTECPYQPFYTKSQLYKIHKLIQNIFSESNVSIALIYEDKNYLFNNEDGFLHRTADQNENWYSFTSKGAIHLIGITDNIPLICVIIFSLILPIIVGFLLIKLCISLFANYGKNLFKTRRENSNREEIAKIFRGRESGVFNEVDYSHTSHVNQISNLHKDEREDRVVRKREENKTTLKEVLKYFAVIQFFDVVYDLLYYLFAPSFVNSKTEFYNYHISKIKIDNTPDLKYFSQIKENYEEFCKKKEFRKENITFKDIRRWGLEIRQTTIKEIHNLVLLYNVQPESEQESNKDFIERCCKISTIFQETDTVSEKEFLSQMSIFTKTPKGLLNVDISELLKEKNVKIVSKDAFQVLPHPEKNLYFDFSIKDQQKKHNYLANYFIFFGCAAILILKVLFSDTISIYLAIVYAGFVLLIYFLKYKTPFLWKFIPNLVIYLINLLILIVLSLPLIYFFYTVEVCYEHYTIQEYKFILSWIDFYYFPWRILEKLPHTMHFYLYLIPFFQICIFVLSYFFRMTFTILFCLWPGATQKQMGGKNKEEIKIGLRQLSNLGNWLILGISIGMIGFYIILWIEWLIIATVISPGAYLEWACQGVFVIYYISSNFGSLKKLYTTNAANIFDICSKNLKDSLVQGINVYCQAEGLELLPTNLLTIFTEKDALKKLFAIADTDKNGIITEDEFGCLARRLGFNLTEEELIDVFTTTKTQIQIKTNQKRKLLKNMFSLVKDNLNKLKELKAAKEANKIVRAGLNLKEFKYAFGYIKILKQKSLLVQTHLDIPSLVIKMIGLLLILICIFIFFNLVISAFALKGGLAPLVPIGGAIIMRIIGSRMGRRTSQIISYNYLTNTAYQTQQSIYIYIYIQIKYKKFIE